MAALLVAMTGCQKEPQANESEVGAESVGYVSLKISLPKETATKADPDMLQNGTGKEYVVNDVTVIFYNANNGYVYHTTVDARPWQNNATGSNITATGKTGAIQVETSEQTLYALALVNADGIYSEGDFVNVGWPDFRAKISGNYDSKLVEDFIGSNKNDFFMSNAPYYEDGEFKSLVPVEVQANAEDALANAKPINVERAVAKVQVKYFNSLHQQEPTNDLGDIARVVGWNLDITNRQTYPVRRCFTESDDAEMDALNTWFINGTLSQAIYDGSRINWAVDPNYSNSEYVYDPTDLGRPYRHANDSDLTLEDVDGTCAYCFENTFNIKCMNENQTTSVLLKVRYTPFIDNNGDNANDITDNDETWFTVGLGKTRMTCDQLADFIEAKLVEGNHPLRRYETKEKLIAALTAKAGKVDNLELDGESGIRLNEIVGEAVCYLNAICYYRIPIRHFDNDELGYTEEEFKQSFETNNGYVAKDLGRYGVVRNNWYNITINKISNPGSADIETPGSGPDDKTEQYVACDINILAWRLRSQSVDL